MQITILPATDLHHQYPSELQAQPAFLVLDVRDGRLWADTDGEVGPPRAVPAEVAYGFVRRYPVPALTAEAANRSLNEIAPAAEKIVAGWSEHFDGSNMVAVLDEDAAAAEAEIFAALGLDSHGGRPFDEDSVFGAGDQVVEWALEGALHGGEVAEYGITAETSDERLDEIADDILAALAECGEGGRAVCPGLREHLVQLRDDLVEDDDVVWSVVRGESPAARAVEPGPLSITVPDAVLEWAAAHGLHVDDPDVYLLVTPQDEAGQITGELAFCYGELPATQVAAIRAALPA